jgi:hypothetical protein
MKYNSINSVENFGYFMIDNTNITKNRPYSNLFNYCQKTDSIIITKNVIIHDKDTNSEYTNSVDSNISISSQDSITHNNKIIDTMNNIKKDNIKEDNIKNDNTNKNVINNIIEINTNKKKKIERRENIFYEIVDEEEFNMIDVKDIINRYPKIINETKEVLRKEQNELPDDSINSIDSVNSDDDFFKNIQLESTNNDDITLSQNELNDLCNEIVNDNEEEEKDEINELKLLNIDELTIEDFQNNKFLKTRLVKIANDKITHEIYLERVKINDEKKKKKREKERFNIFLNNKSVYRRITNNKKKDKKVIGVLFRDKYIVFQFMDDNELLSDENVKCEITELEYNMFTNLYKVVESYALNIDKDDKEELNDPIETIDDDYKELCLEFIDILHNTGDEIKTERMIHAEWDKSKDSNKYSMFDKDIKPHEL